MKSIVAGLLFLCGLARAQDHGVQMESFEKVWQTIAEKHWNPKQLEKLPDGGSWVGIRESYRKRIAAAQSATEVRHILREMVARIGKSHYAISGYEASGTKALRRGGGTAPGFAVEWIEGKVLVTAVRRGGPAEAAGVKAGWEAVSADGVAISSDPGVLLHAELRRHQVLQQQISGYGGEKLEYVFRAGSDEKRVTIQLPKSDGSVGFGFMQGMEVQREFRLIGKQDVGYFRLDLFLDAVRVLPQFEQAIKNCAACKGFVIDLRGNPGGLAVMANALAGWFVSKSGVKLGTMYQRGVDLNFIVIPRLNGFTGPLAVLVDGASASTSEILAGGLQDFKRARVFGAQTAGAALPSVIEVLPNGDFFQYAVANYVSASGLELEGRGVIPDVVVGHTAEALRQGKDRPLEAALDWIYANPIPADRPAQR